MSNKVTYAEIIEALSEKTDFSKQKSEAFAKALIARVKQELEETGKASITNFGSFKVKQVAERQGQNPQTGEPITIPAHNRVSFTPYKALKEEVNAMYAHLETELIGEEQTSEIQEEEQQSEPEIAEEEKQEEAADEVASTSFTFDEDSAAEEIAEEEAVEEKPEKEENPFAFDEPDPEPEEEHEELELDETPVFEEPTEEKSNVAFIMLLAGVLVVAMASVWWFFLKTDTENIASEQAVIEQPQTPEAMNQVIENDEDETEPEMTQEESSTKPPAQAEEQSAQQTDVMSDAAEPTVYQVNQNEWYWVIAKKVYGSSRLWPLIYQENFTTETHPDSLAKEAELKVPKLEGTVENPTKGDYQRLAEASRLVSEAYQKFGRTDKAEEYALFAKKWEKLGM